MIGRTRQFRVGLLVLGAIALFVALVAFIAGSSLQRDSVTFRILFHENVKGMVIGSRVNFMGVPVGAVSDVRFQAGATLVELTIDPRKASVQDVTRARLDRLLVTGQVTVELEGWSRGARSLSDGSYIEAVANPIAQLAADLPALADRADRLLAGADELVRRLNELLADENLAHVENLLANLDDAGARLPGCAQRLLSAAETAVSRVGPAFDEVRAAADEIRGAVAGAVDPEQVRSTLAAAEAGLLGLERSSDRVRELADELRRVVAGNAPALHDAMLGFRAAVVEIQGLARRLRAAPSSLFFGADAREITVPASPGGSR